jgi:hypothetical protein
MIAGHQISKELCDALGLPKLTRGFTLRCYTGELVSVECEYYPDSSFQLALAQYHLVPRDGAPLADAPFDFGAWMRERTECAHREFMERTSRRLPCDWTTEEIARYFRVPLEQLE